MRQPTILATLVLSGALAACGGDSNSVDAAVSADARPPDAGTPDAAEYTGQVAFHDVRLFGVPSAGHGLQTSISFTKLGSPVTATVTSSPFPPCSASLFDTQDSAQNPPGLDVGTIKTTVTKSGGGPGLVVPDCKFAGSSYNCPAGGGTGGSIAAAANNPSTIFTFTDNNASATYGADQLGRYLVVTGDPGKGLALPIVGASGNMLALQHASTVTAPGAVGAFAILAGIGPAAVTANVDGSSLNTTAPLVADTGDTFHFALPTPSVNGPFAAFAKDVVMPPDFNLDANSTALLAGEVDVSGDALTIGCAGGGTKCNGAVGLIVTIESTDATSFPGGPSDMGTPARYAGSLTCTAFGSSVTIPKNVLNVLSAKGKPTKLRIAVFADNLAQEGQSKGINFVVGHGIIKFQ